MSSKPAAAFRWLQTSDDAFAAMLDAIDAEADSVRLEMYIFSAEAIGARFRDALVAACVRGVRVQVLIDAWGSIDLPDAFWIPLKKAGGEFRWFNPIRLNRFAIRNHRKSLICGDKIAIVGGFNIAPEYEGDGVTRGWRDLGLSLTGPLAQKLAENFDLLFARADYRHPRFARLRKSPLPNRLHTSTGDILSGRPGRGRNVIKQSLAADFAHARRVQIIASYFLPTWPMRRALARVVRRGGQVQLLLAGHSDVPMAQLASQRLYQSLLRAGIEIYEYQPQILHAKLIVVDNTIYAGSANFDIRSLNINYELLVRLPNATLAKEARSTFANDLEHSRRIEPVAWRKSRSFWRRIRERWAYFMFAHVDPYISRRQMCRPR